jgi:hypothetical protein
MKIPITSIFKAAILLFVSLAGVTNVFASESAPSKQTKDKKNESKVETSKTTKTGSDHNFEDLLVQGKYHFSDEAVTTVEEDKVLDALLGVRAEFKDRM